MYFSLSWPLYKCCINPMLQAYCVDRNSFNHWPPLTSPLVQTADMDNVVRVVTTTDKSPMTVAKPIPACPTTQESRKYSRGSQIAHLWSNQTWVHSIHFYFLLQRHPNPLPFSCHPEGLAVQQISLEEKSHFCCYKWTKFCFRFEVKHYDPAVKM